MSQRFVSMFAMPVHSALDSVAGSIIHLSRNPRSVNRGRFQNLANERYHIRILCVKAEILVGAAVNDIGYGRGLAVRYGRPLRADPRASDARANRGEAPPQRQSMKPRTPHLRAMERLR